MKEVENICGVSESESGCLVCGRSLNAPVPFPTALAKLQNQHESILHQIRVFVRNVKGTTGPRGKNSHASKNLKTRFVKTRYFIRLRKLVAEHQREEERVLIPIVDKYIDTKASETMRREHTEIWKALQKLSTFQSVAEFEVMAREQFSREENVIYWFASLCLSRSDQPFNCLGPNMFG